MKPNEILVRVVSDRRPAFVAGFVYDEKVNRCTLAAPILRRWVLGKGREEIRQVVRNRGWKATPLKT